MQKILSGLKKFRNEVYPQHRELFEQLATAQSPEVLFITCADSRVVPQMITQADAGELFVCRNAGNMVPPYGEVHGGVSATIEYAIEVLNVRHVIVCGHTDCGAMKGVLYPEKVAALPTVRSWLAHGDRARRVVRHKYPDLNEQALMHAITEENVVAQLDNLRTHPSVAARLSTGDIALHGWVYHIRTGEVEAWDPAQSRFVQSEEFYTGALAQAGVAAEAK
jgi:carbonic anhydrase